jgi:PAS domain S-box-containing protein
MEREKAHRFSSKHYLAAILALLFVLDVFALWFVAKTDYDRTLERARIVLQKTSISLEERVKRTVFASEAILRNWVRRIQEKGIGETISSVKEWRQFRSTAQGLPDAGSLWLLDNKGNLLMDSTQYPSQRMNFSEREYFVPQRDLGIELYIGPVVKGKITKKYSFTISHRINGKDGSFLGIVLAAIDTDDFTNFLRYIDIGEEGTVTVFSTDGAMILRQPMQDEYLGKTFKHLKLFSMPFNEGPSGIYETAAIDGTKRLIAYRKIQELPLLVATGIPVDSILQGWKIRVKIYSLIAAIAFFLLVGLSWLVRRSTSREEQEKAKELSNINLSLQAEIIDRERAQLALGESEQRWATTLASIGDAVIATDADGRITFMNAVAEALTGWSLPEASTKQVPEVFNIINEYTHRQVENPVTKVLREGMIVGLANHTTLVRKNGTEVPIDDSGAPIRDGEGNTMGVVLVFRDITERKKAEQDLKNAHDDLEHQVERRTAQLRQQAELLDLAHDAIILTDKDGRITFWSAGASETYGFSKEEAVGKFIGSLLKRKSDAPVEDILAIVEREGRWEGELVHTCREGREVLVHSRWTIRQNEATGKPEIMEVNRDITTRKRVEQALIALGAYNRSLIEASPDPLVTIDPLGRISDVNIATERVTGYSRDMIIGTDFSDYFTDPEKARAVYHQVFREGIVKDYELEIRHRDGHVTPVLYNASIYKDETGRVIGVFAAARDISERRRIERALQESEERYRIAIESASDGIAIVKGDQHAYVNARFAEMFGYRDPDEVIGKPLTLTVHPDDLAMVSETNRMRQKGESVPFRYEFRGIRKDGTLRHIEVSAARTHYRGEPVSLAYLRDITEYKNLEDQLRQAQKMEAIGTLAGGIAHDFNNLLAAIIGFSEMVEEDLPVGSASYLHIKRILNAAFRGRDLVKQILTFSRKTEHVRSKLSLSPLIKETIQLLRASLPTTIAIEFSMKAARDTVLASPAEVQQILMNLATNAAAAMREEGGTLGIALTDVEFEPDSPIVDPDIEPGDYVQLSVTDTGIGMTHDILKRIFEPFFTTKKVGEGTGMGLAVVYGIVKGLHGTITVESEPGIGSTFRVLLPAILTDNRTESNEVLKSPGGSERILFIDDEDFLTEWGQLVLERLGYTVTAVQDSEEALALFRKDPSRFDLVITDQTMPKLTGLHLAQELLKIRNDIPIILCTGHSDTVSPEKAKAIGVREFVMKPLAKQELADVVRKVLVGA